LRIVHEHGRRYIEDDMSTNGTKLNGKEIKGTGKHPLTDGDQITVANVITILYKAGRRKVS